MSLAWPPGPFLYAWTPHPFMAHALPPRTVRVHAENGEHARACMAIVAVLAIRKYS